MQGQGELVIGKKVSKARRVKDGGVPMICKWNFDVDRLDQDASSTTGRESHASRILPMKVLGTTPGNAKWSYLFPGSVHSI